jgi:hypothetical protein
MSAAKKNFSSAPNPNGDEKFQWVYLLGFAGASGYAAGDAIGYYKSDRSDDLKHRTGIILVETAAYCATAGIFWPLAIPLIYIKRNRV